MKIRLSVGAGLVAAGVVVTGGIPALAGSTAVAPAAIVAGTGSFGAVHIASGPVGPVGESGIGTAGLSCVPHGRCVAVVDDISLTGTANQAYLVTDNGGTWSALAPIPGLEAGTGNSATVDDVSCPAPGDCLVEGDYHAGADRLDYGFVQEEVNGTWGQPEAIPGLAALGNGVQVGATVACPAPGYCTVAGRYTYGTGTASSGFVADEVAYKWGTAQPVPGLATLNVGGSAGASNLACPTSRNCTIEGTYTAKVTPSGTQADIRIFVDSEVNGSWQQASGPAIPNAATSYVVPQSNLACASAGNCLASVRYTVASTNATAQYLLRQSGGKWSVSTASQMLINVIACPAVNSCVAGGAAQGQSIFGVAATMHQVNGTWTAPATLPGVTSLTFQGVPEYKSAVTGLACPSAGNCTAVGSWDPNPDPTVTEYFGFVASEASGTWSRALVPAGNAALDGNEWQWDFTGVACAAVATCAMAGEYGGLYETGAFVVPEIPLRASATTIGRSLGTVTFGKEQAEKIAVHVTGPSTPTAKVTVRAGSKTVCTITLNGSGVGTCLLTASQLPVGSYQLVAGYPGSYGLASSSSRAVPLSVVK